MPIDLLSAFAADPAKVGLSLDQRQTTGLNTAVCVLCWVLQHSGSSAEAFHQMILDFDKKLRERGLALADKDGNLL